MLKLNLPRHARCLVTRITHEAFILARDTGLWALETRGDDRRVWERLYAKDHVLLWDIYEQQIDLLGAEVVGKTLDLSIPKSERPLRLLLRVHGTARVRRMPLHGYNMRDDLFCPPGDFLDLWSQCSPAEATSEQANPDVFYEFHGIQVRVASTLNDLQYIQDFARSHSFGYRTAFLTLVAQDHKAPVGALLAQPSGASIHSHRAAAQVFGSAYEHFLHDSLSIKRIFTSDLCKNKLGVQEALIRGFLEIAPFMVEGSLRIIEAASYDPHPLTQKLGFHAELPELPTGSIYYWKPFNLPKSFVDARATNVEDTERAMHSLVTARAHLKFYAVFGRLQDFGVAEREHAWALEGSLANRGLWKSLRKGDTIFFVRDRQMLEGYAVVETTRFDQSLGSRPLRIEFSRVEMPYIAADLTIEPFSEWLQIPTKGGVFSLRGMAGSQLLMAVDRRQSEGKMWVIPNQYLLPGTSFVCIPKQIFVVQAWALKDDVLPTLRDILASDGYSVTHAEDREGQVIFGDIWKLMNEAEIVLVDFTDKRPNVYLEYGMAIVLGKPIVAISQRREDMPSDTPQLKVIEYINSMAGTKALAPKLLRAVKDRKADLGTINGHRT